MKKQSKTWASPSLGEKMKLSITGEEGTPVLWLTTTKSDGKPDTGILKSGIGFQLENGFNKVYEVQCLNDEILLSTDSTPRQRIVRYGQFESYIIDEVVPFILKDSDNDFIIVAGVGTGAYHASNLMFKHPEKFGKLISICGPFNNRRFYGDYFDDDVYYNNPAEFIPYLDDEQILGRIRESDLRIVSSFYDPYKVEAIELTENLDIRSIDYQLDIWGEERPLDDETFAEMLKNHIP